MKTDYAKKIYNRLPEWVKLVTATTIRNRLIYNPIFTKQYRELLEADLLSDVELQKKQFNLLKSTCIHAYEHTIFYRKEFDRVHFDPYRFESFEEFSNIVPTIDKNIIIDNYDEFNSDDISDYYPATTGGSSGTRLQVNNSRETFYRENAFIYHFMYQYGYDYRKSKVLLLAGEESESLCSSSPLYGMIRISGRHLNQYNFSRALRYVNRYKPDYIIAIPSAAYQFCKYLKQSELSLESKIKHTFFRSENLNPKQRAFIEEVLKCKSSEYYGSTERIALGEELANSEGIPLYRFNRLYGYTEIDSADGCSLVGTGFINPKMPLIRYRTDDTITERLNGYYMIEGHRNSVLVGKNGESISPEFFCHLEETFDILEKYQLNQYEQGKALANVVPRRELSIEEECKIKKLFEKMAADKIQFDIRVVDDVELTPRGKFKLLYHSIDKEV